MEYRNLGRTGLKVSALSYGAWVSFGNQLDVKDAKVLLSRCREAGVNFFDNAEVYANGRAEEIMGSAIKELGWKRSDVVISTKLFWGGQGPNDKGLSRKHIIEGIKVCVLSLFDLQSMFLGCLLPACLHYNIALLLILCASSDLCSVLRNLKKKNVRLDFL
jgi:aryl-alcohol dehydrogenase-like predicted oxidoreductase